MANALNADVFSSEQQVEQMIERGRRIMAEAIETYRPVAVIAAFSGGNDSVVSTHFASEEFDALAVHCGTSIGLKASSDHVVKTCERFGWDLRVETAAKQGMPVGFDEGILPSGRWDEGETAYEQFILNFGFPGPAQHLRMFQRLKERPLRVVTRDLKVGHSRNDTILVVSGIRQDESAIRAGYKRATMKEHGQSRVWVNPFYWNTALDFEAYRQEFSLPRNPVKSRIGVSGECLCGSFAQPGEKEAIRGVDPDMGTYLDNLESKVKANGLPCFWGQRPDTRFGGHVPGSNGKFVMTDGLRAELDRYDDADASDASDFMPMCVGCKLHS